MDDVGHRFRISLRPSRTLMLALGSGYAGAAACLFSLDLGFGIKGLMLAILILSCFCDLYTYAGRRRRRRVSEIVFCSEGDWRVTNGVGEVRRGKPVPGRLVHPLAVCFSIRLGDAKQLPVLVLGDMCSAEAFRRLRAWLGVHGGNSVNRFARTRPFPNTGGGDDFRP